MFRSSANERAGLELRLLHAATLLVALALAGATEAAPWKAAFGDDPPRQAAKQSQPQKDAGSRDTAAERKLLADLETALAAHADHLDYSRTDRELAAAFRGYGLDLDAVAPKVAGARLAAGPATPEIASAIDRWCRLRKMALNLPTWRQLDEVARAADPDPWRNGIRDQYDRPAADTRAALKARAADAQALEKQPVHSLLVLSQMLSEASDRPAAASVLRVAKQRFPGDFWVCLMQGKLQVDGAPNPDVAEANRSLAAAAALRPKSPLPHLYLGTAFQQQRKFREAIAEFREAIRLKPDSPDVHLTIGHALVQTGEVDEAISRYREAIRLKPGEAPAHLYLVAALLANGKPDEAVAACREAIRIKPNDSEAQLALGHSLGQQGNADGALSAFREATRLKPDDSRTQYYLGSALVRHGKTDEAITTLRRAIRLNADDAQSHLMLGYVLEQKGKLNDAIASYREAIRLKPDDPQAHSYHGSALHSAGKLDDSAAAYRKAISL